MQKNGDPNQKLQPNPGYVVNQLLRAMSTSATHPDLAARQRALERVKRWEQVFRGMFDGSISVGSRTPIRGIPRWVTLDVAHGGFAVGSLAGGGPLQPHETDLLSRLGHGSDGHERATLNVYYISESGRRDLCEMLRTGGFKITVPEEGALLVVAWLIDHKMEERAHELLDLIVPFFDRLRFYPVPDVPPIVESNAVRRNTVGEIVESLRLRRPQVQVGRMLEALRIWLPMYDRAVALFLETVEDQWPCRRYPNEWRMRAQSLLNEYQDLRKVHKLCGKPDRPKENFARLRSYMKTCIDSSSRLSGRDVGRLRTILASYLRRHGAPGSEKLVRRRTEQAQIAGRPTHDELNQVLRSRLARLPGDSGLPDMTLVASPVSPEESARFHVPPSSNMPKSLLLKAQRCWQAPIEQLVRARVIPSGEVLAQVLPQITSHVQGADIPDEDLRRLYRALYSAFRRRRSLLLLNLEHQIRLEELPWASAVDGVRRETLNTRGQSRQTLEQLSTLAILSFPESIFPNKLLQELTALSTSAGLPIPIVDELAADIFVGEFSVKFLQAAKIAARLLQNSLYERYFGLSYERVLHMTDVPEGQGPRVSPEFARLCEELAGTGDNTGRSVARNGKVIEQAQIITTHNLAALFAILDLQGVLGDRLRALSERCFSWICRRLAVKTSSWKAGLRLIKKSAYAWRQMVFFLSFIPDDEVHLFLAWARNHLEEQKLTIQEKLLPALRGLELVASGGVFDRDGIGGKNGEACRFLGWTTERHWVLGPNREDDPAARQ
jgi:hypothetical protein